MVAWELAWNEAKAETAPRPRAVAEFALGEYLDLSSKVGHADALAAKFGELAGRNVTGAASQKVGMAREALSVFRVHHELAAASGAVALESLLGSAAYAAGRPYTPNAILRAYHATPAGTTLKQLQTLAQSVGLSYVMGFRPPDAVFPVPSVVHFRVDHYSAIVKEQSGRYLLLDPILGGQQWVSREALTEESSGYFLVPPASLTGSWRSVSDTEAATVVGHCLPGAPDDSDPGGPPDQPPPPTDPPPQPPCPRVPPADSSVGMPRYSLQRMSASLRIQDTPVSCSSPAGPSARFQLTYNQRAVGQPQIFTYGNVGPKWTFDWLSSVVDDPTSADVLATVYLRGGGAEYYYGGAPSGTYNPHWRSRAVLAKTSTSPIRYERRLRDGGMEVFAQPDGVITAGRRVLLTDVIDPQGLSLHFTYDANLRLVAVTDALNLVTRVDYDPLSVDPTRITSVTEPYGRVATLTYNAAGELQSITDVIGMQSSFVYSTADFIASMTTPYGTTVFTHETNPMLETSFRFIQATDPLGGTERVEFRFYSTPGIPAVAPAGEVPTGFSAYNTNLDQFNSLYWDKRAMALYPGDVSKATVTHWLFFLYESFNPQYFSHAFSTSVPHSVKRPLENRVWYVYPDQANAQYVGSWIQPAKVARVLDDGTSQIWQATYNTMGNVTTQTDPLGRQQTLTYFPNGIDLSEVRQTTGGLNDRLASFANYTTQHRPQTITDAAGQPWAITYNAYGQPLTVTNPKNEPTTSAYNPPGFLQSVTGAISGATTTYAYDGYGRPRTVTFSDGYALTTDYDLLDRPTSITYPDGTSDRVVYNRLDVEQKVDRLGRVTRLFYDRVGRLTALRDPLGRLTTYQWCTCGTLDKLIDGKGQATTWELDAQGRITRELRADGVTATRYTYETTTSRLKTVTDPKVQVATYTYNLDDTQSQVVYTNAEHPTPSVSWAYDPNYKRLASMTDGAGTTGYAYKLVGTLGATQVASVTGPLTGVATTYTYDELGRTIGRAVNGVGRTLGFDRLGRVQTDATPLGTFGYTYVATTERLDTTTLPNGQTTTYVYYPNTADRRLQTLHHHKPGGATLSKFDYTYDGVGNIVSWTQQADSAAAIAYQFGYDTANQLTLAAKQATGGAVLQRFAYGYDAASNRTSEQIDDNLLSVSLDSRNRLTSQTVGGAERFAGTVSKPATVTIQGQPATVDAANNFSGTAQVVSGTTTVTITARDGSNNQSTAIYQVDQAGSGRIWTYDANGNLTADGGRTFEWDARNQLLAVSQGTHRSEFTYDGWGHRVRIVEKDGGLVTTDRRYVWCGGVLCEERDASGATVTKRFFSQGVQDSGTSYLYTADYVGSVRELTDATGAVRARYDYDPFGRRTKLSGDLNADAGFTGHYQHAPSGLVLAPFRAYDPNLGRWISEDPSGLAGGPNRYAYVGGNPLKWIDPSGLQRVPPPVPVPGGGPDNGWKWNPDPGNPRGGTWGPIKSIPGQSPPTGSFDDKTGHWDIDNGLGTRTRFDPNGNPMTPDQAHPRPPPGQQQQQTPWAWTLPPLPAAPPLTPAVVSLPIGTLLLLLLCVP